MGEAVANGDRFLAVLSEVGEVLGNGIVVVDESAFDENSDGDRGRGNFRNGGEVVDRVDGAFFYGRFGLAIAVSAQERDLIAASDGDDGAREVAVGNSLFNERVDTIERFGVHIELFWRDDRLRHFSGIRVFSGVREVGGSAYRERE